MRVEVLAVGTELLLGQIADTNGAWIGEQLAAAGVSSHFHQAVGDNHDRIVLALRTALARSDGVVVCGGLGPTQDDITREAIAEVMNVALRHDPEAERRIAAFFRARGREMSPSNRRQAQVPENATIIEQTRGTAPGIICPVGNKVVYALPGVPHEMMEMFERGVLPDLRRRLIESGEQGVIGSRVLRTWGTSESQLAEVLAGRVDELEGAAGGVTLAFLASGIEGIKVRLTARAGEDDELAGKLDREEAVVRRVLQQELGRDVVFGVDEETMETVLAALLVERQLSLAVAESLTGGLIASRLVAVPGASRWFRGGVVAYSSDVKHEVLGVPEGPVVSATAAGAMAAGVRRALSSSVALGITGVAGPDEQEGQRPGTVFVGLALPDRPVDTHHLVVPGDRERVRQYAAISALDLLRRALQLRP